MFLGFGGTCVWGVRFEYPFDTSNEFIFQCDQNMSYPGKDKEFSNIIITRVIGYFIVY